MGAPGGEGRGSGPAALRAGARPGQGARPGRLHPPQTPPNTPGLGRRREVAHGRGQTVLAPQCPQGGGSSQRRPEPGTALPGSGLGRSGGPPSQRVASLCSRKGGAPAPGSRLTLQPAPRAGGDVCPRLPLPPVAPGAPWGPGPPSCAKSRAHGDLLEGLVAGQAQGSGPEPGGPATCSAMGSTQGRRAMAPSVALFRQQTPGRVTTTDRVWLEVGAGARRLAGPAGGAVASDLARQYRGCRHPAAAPPAGLCGLWGGCPLPAFPPKTRAAPIQEARIPSCPPVALGAQGGEL